MFWLLWEILITGFKTIHPKSTRPPVQVSSVKIHPDKNHIFNYFLVVDWQQPVACCPLDLYPPVLPKYLMCSSLQRYQTCIQWTMIATIPQTWIKSWVTSQQRDFAFAPLPSSKYTLPIKWQMDAIHSRMCILFGASDYKHNSSFGTTSQFNIWKRSS